MKYLRHAADLLRPTDMLSLRAVALNNLGEVHLDLGDLDAAAECCAEARDIWREIGGYGEGWALHNLGRVYLALGRIGDAATSLTDAIGAHRASGELVGQATALKYLGHARLAASDPGEARTSWTQALSIFEQIDERAEAAEVAASLASLPRS